MRAEKSFTQNCVMIISYRKWYECRGSFHKPQERDIYIYIKPRGSVECFWYIGHVMTSSCSCSQNSSRLFNGYTCLLKLYKTCAINLVQMLYERRAQHCRQVCVEAGLSLSRLFQRCAVFVFSFLF